MGEFFFFYPTRQIADALARRGFAAGRGRKPVRTAIRVEKYGGERKLLVVSAGTSESCSFYFPRPDARDNFFYASTDPLPPSSRPRSLYLELSRGQLSRIQRKRADWSYLGFSTPARLRQQIHRAIRKFSALVTEDSDAEGFDERSFSLFSELCGIGDKLNELYLDKTLAARRKFPDWFTRFGFAAEADENWIESYDPLFIGAKSGKRPKFPPLFQTLNLRVNWRDVERNGYYDWSRLDAAIRSARARGLRVTLGPLVRWGADLPERLRKPTLNAEFLLREYEGYLGSALDAIGGRVERWIVATNVETSPDPATFEFRLAVAKLSAGIIRKRFPRSQVFLGFEQAFGDSARFGEPPLAYPIDLASRLAPRHFFDGFYLEANFGLTPRTTAPRDPMELHRFFDRWSAFGAKLVVATSCPDAAPFEYSASREKSEQLFAPREDKGKRLFCFRDRAALQTLEGLVWSVQTQQELARRFYSSALARRAVEEIVWTRWVDAPLMSCGEYAALTNVYDAESIEFGADANQSDAADVYDEILPCDDEFREENESDEEETLDDVDLLSDESSLSRSESVSFSAEVDAPDDVSPTSGLLGLDYRPKATLHKLAALHHAYLGD